MFDQMVVLKKIFYLLAVHVLEFPGHTLREICQRDLILKSMFEEPLNCFTIDREFIKVVH
jgi:hypothetical protein